MQEKWDTDCKISMERRVKTIALAVTATIIFTGHAYPLINPSLQPIHLYDRYKVVLSLQVSAVDYEKHIATLDVKQLAGGEFTPKKVVVSPAGDNIAEVFEELMFEELTIVAFVGKTRRNHEKDVLFYPGDGRWQVGLLESSEDLSRWQWTEDLGPEAMFGTFNGSSERLAEMMVDRAQGRYFHPARPFTQFKDDLVIDKFKGPVRGVALYDIDADGDLDIYACSENGNRAYLQAAPLAFQDATKKLGLDGLKGVSVSFADVNADSRADLLAGGVIYLAASGLSTDGFSASKLLPAEADNNVKSSAFVDVNGDGYPDVIISKANGGLAVYLNPGRGGSPFTNATQALGLDVKECGAGGNGFFAPGDWNQDGHTDLFYAVANGLMLVQQETGRFAPAGHYLAFDFKTGGQMLGLTGAGCFGPLWRPDRPDLIFSSESSLNLVVSIEGKLKEMSYYGNELTECSFGHLAVIAEDFNADGYVDIYAASRSILPNMFYTNRGYGSFMTPHKYKRDALPGKAHQRGAWGLAVGDVNGDGANDLLLGGVDGTLTLMVNDTLSSRKQKEHPTYHEEKLFRTKILIVKVTGKLGVLGAKVTLTGPEGEIAAHREIGSNVNVGCCSPPVVNLAVRRPGIYALTVRFSDGIRRKWNVDLRTKGRAILNARHD